MARNRNGNLADGATERLRYHNSTTTLQLAAGPGGPGPWGKEGEKEDRVDRVGLACHPDLAMSYHRFALKLSSNSFEFERRLQIRFVKGLQTEYCNPQNMD